MDLALREAVRRRANGTCEYCQFPESFHPFPFHLDHVIPLKHRGATTLGNLSWACLDCNLHKGTDIAGLFGPQHVLQRLFNPRSDIWNNHFFWNGSMLEPKTPMGEVTIDLLQINRPDRVLSRSGMIAANLF